MSDAEHAFHELSAVIAATLDNQRIAYRKASDAGEDRNAMSIDSTVGELEALFEKSIVIQARYGLNT